MEYVLYWLMVFHRTVNIFAIGTMICAISTFFITPTSIFNMQDIQFKQLSDVSNMISGFIPWIILIGTFKLTFLQALKDFKRRHYI